VTKTSNASISQLQLQMFHSTRHGFFLPPSDRS